MVKRYAAGSGLSEADARGILGPAHPLGGTGDPGDVAWGAVYLADQARWVTGSELVIDNCTCSFDPRRYQQARSRC